MTQPEIVTDQARLEELCHAWRKGGCFAFDTEFIRDETYHAALCLIQVAVGGQVVVVDPTADVDVAAFWALVCDPAVLTIVHAGKEDFDVCLRETGRPPRNVFDVQIAAGFVGLGYPLSLSRLILALLHKRIAKGLTLTDWLRRPLTDEQVRYAVEDVAHLPAAHERLSALLEKTGRASWAAEEFKRFEHAHFYKPPIQDRLLRLKGARKLDDVGLAVLERLVEWRERWARERNRPIRALVRDDILVEIARRRPTRPAQLEVFRGFPQARNPRVIGEILRLIHEGAATPRQDRPQPHEFREESPMLRAALDVLSAYTRARCHAEGVANELVGGTARLRELMDFRLGRSAEQPALLSGWRAEFIGRRLVDLLEGRTELHLTGWPDKLHLEVITHTDA